MGGHDKNLEIVWGILIKNIATMPTSTVTMMNIIISNNLGLIQGVIKVTTESGTKSAKMKTVADAARRLKMLVSGRSFTGLKNIAIPTTIRNILVK